MGRRRHPKNLPQCAGTVNSLLFFHIHKSASFFSKCFNFKLNTMQIFNLGQKKPQAGFRPWTGFPLFLQVQIQCLHTWMAIYLFVYLFTMVIFFIMNLGIFVLCFCFQHKNLCICNLCTGIFKSIGKRLRSAEDNQCRLNLSDDTELYWLYFFSNWSAQSFAHHWYPTSLGC